MSWRTFIDISKWQGTVNFATMQNSGVDALYMRAFQGVNRDVRVDEYASGANAHGIPFGIYIYWRPGHDYDRQISQFVEAHRDLGASLIPMLDIEHHDDKTPEEIGEQVTRAVVDIERLLNVTPVIYTAGWFWNPRVRGADVSRCPLWLARYTRDKPPVNPADWPEFAMSRSQPVLPNGGWSSWDAWQFSADGNHAGATYGVSSSHLDLNILRGESWDRFQVDKSANQIESEVMSNSLFDRSRSSWEQAGMTVGEHTDARPIIWGRVDSVVIHYTAAETADTDTARWLAQMQRSYVNGRGYSLGYSCAIDQQGICWEIRGTDYIPAATKNENGHTFAVLQLVDWQNPANDLMVQRTRQLISQLRQQNRMSITGHRDWAATRCPGDGVYHQIVTGVFEPVPIPPTPPTPGPEVEMRLIDPPQRVFDSRSQGGRFSAGETRRVPVGHSGAVFVNVTAVDPTGSGWLAVWGGGPLPSVSNVNFTHGVTIANSAWVPVSNGHVQVYVSQSADVIIDVQAVAQ